MVIPTRVPAAIVIEEMEKEPGKEMFDSVLMSLWQELRIVGVYTPPYGCEP